ncbi:hypothetical protein C8R45DRAFT_982731 [Mycena sanguinolenta]|nr:hypothetical protein C8R45DRAFT_982731 [Mycena sanguinolenta]
MRRVPNLPTSSIARSKLRPRPGGVKRRWRYHNLRHTMRQADLFHQWEIPLDAYKHISPGPRFSILQPDWRLAGNFGQALLALHPRLESIPPPQFAAAASASSESALNRSLVIKGLVQSNLSRFLMRIHEGPLEFARLDPEDLISSPFPLSALPRSYSLTLSFLSSKSAHAFVHTHLSVPASLYEFSRSPNPTWQWLFPPPPLPQPVLVALRKYTARRAVSVSWFDDADKDCAAAVERFGDVEHVWKFSSNRRFVVQFYAINDAICAHTELRTNSRLRVSFFPDWCEMDEQGRDLLKKQDAWYGRRMNNGRPAPRIVSTAATEKRVVSTPPRSPTGTSRSPTPNTTINPRGPEPSLISTPAITNDIQKFYLGQVMHSLTGFPVSHLLEEFRGVQAGSETEEAGEGTVMSWLFNHTSASAADQYYHFPTGPYKKSFFEQAKVASSAGKVVAAPHTPAKLPKRDSDTSGQTRREQREASEPKSNVKPVAPVGNNTAAEKFPLSPPFALDMQKWYIRQVVRSITGAMGWERSRWLMKSVSKAANKRNDDDDSILSLLYDNSTTAEYSDEALDSYKRQAKLAYLGVEEPTSVPKDPSPLSAKSPVTSWPKDKSSPSASQVSPISTVRQGSVLGESRRARKRSRRGEWMGRLMRARRAAKADRNAAASVSVSATGTRPGDLTATQDENRIGIKDANAIPPAKAKQEPSADIPVKGAIGTYQVFRNTNGEYGEFTALSSTERARIEIPTSTPKDTSSPPPESQASPEVADTPDQNRKAQRRERTERLIKARLAPNAERNATTSVNVSAVGATPIPTPKGNSPLSAGQAPSLSNAEWRKLANLSEPLNVSKEDDPAAAERLDAIVGLQIPQTVGAQGLPGGFSAGNETPAAKSRSADDTTVQSGG